jgi:FkbM family methyltransferase
LDSIFRYYSQNGEDYILWNFFDHKLDGFFIDVGAFDGIHLSNSYSFEQKGWKGICVEPHPFFFKICKENRKQSVCVNAACVANDETDNIVIESDITGLFASVQYNPDLKNIKDHYGTLNKTIQESKKFVVQAQTLNKIIKKYYNDISIDFISIDVEGLELSVLEGLDLRKYSPKLFLIETNSDEDQENTTEFLSSYGYLFARRVNSNSFFAKSNADINKIRDIEITCVLEKQMHPLGSAFSQQEYLNGKILYKGENGNSLLIHCSDKILNYEMQLQERNLKVKTLLNKLEDQVMERNQKVKTLLKHLDDQVKLVKILKKDLEDKH